ALRQAFSVRHDSFPRDMAGLEQELRRSVAKRATWTVAAIAGLFLMSVGAISYFIWRSSLPTGDAYEKDGQFACFNDAEYPTSWRDEASFCAPYGCNFGKLPQDACLTLGARKGSKTVIHGNVGGPRSNECWLQHSCGDLRPHSEFTFFRM